MLSQLINDKDLQKIIAIFIVYKIIILSFGTIAYYAIPSEVSHKNTELNNPLIRPWNQFDTRAYINIATQGYNYQYGTTTTNFGWYPFYSLLIKTFSFAGYDIAAYIIPQVFSLLAIVSLYILLRDQFGKSRTKKTIFYILMFPSAYFLTALYTESIFLFFSCMAFYFSRKEQWVYAGAMGYLATLTRFIGISMFIPILYMYLRTKKFSIKNIDRKILPIFMILAAFLTLVLYHYITFGNPLLQFYTQSQFSRGIGLPHQAFINTIHEIEQTKSIFVLYYDYFNIAMSLLFIFILIIFWRKMPLEYNLYMLFSFIMIFSSGILSSVTRFELVMFPIFVCIASIAEKSRKYNIMISIIFIAFFALQFIALANHVNGEINLVSVVKGFA